MKSEEERKKEETGLPYLSNFFIITSSAYLEDWDNLYIAKLFIDQQISILLYL